VLGQNIKETKSMDAAEPVGASPIDESRDKPLMADLEHLSEILSKIVEGDDSRAHNLYEEFRTLGMERSQDIDDVKPLAQMVAKAKDLTADEALGVTRTFSIMLNLVNSAEVTHRFRNLRKFTNEMDNDAGPLPNVEDSVAGTIKAILTAGDATPEQIYKQLLQQKVEIVLTAHPTQVQRKSLLRKYAEVTETLAYLERPDLNTFERSQARQRLERVVSSIWGADEIRRTKPRVQQEAAGGLAILESVLWEAVPEYLRKLDNQCQLALGKKLPIDVSPINFASWIGGDRDGNPNVTPDVTREVVLQQRLRAARLLIRDLNALFADLALSKKFSPELMELAASVKESPHKRELYRRVIGHLIQRLVKTAREYEAELTRMKVSAVSSGNVLPENSFVVEGWQNVEPLYDVEELMQPLKVVHDSLVQSGFDLVANGLLVDIIRRLAVFGMSLVRLDIREESTRHTMALDAITRHLGIGSYKEWTEEARLSWLTSELSSKRPLLRFDNIDEYVNFDSTVITTLKTFEMASQIRSADLGAYVISQAQTASDVLAVMLLQKQFGMTSSKGNMMRVVPLFETLDDLVNAPSVLETLFSIPLYVGAVKGRQEVMVGYSDSAKDAGRLAACWAQYNSQEKMAKCAALHNIELTFFHGKGGTVGRGGNPSVYRAIMSHPPGTINGRFRVTEQGEMITQNFGANFIAQRTLDTYTSAVCREAFTRHVEPSAEWRNRMAKISDMSCADYRYLVREEPRFVPYFRQATPELELGSLNIGSRPAKRKPKGGIESLRAIPWTFAWAQTRAHLSAWLGVSAGLQYQDEAELNELRAMYKQWPWFRENVDLIAMILSKSDFSIQKNYDEQLVEQNNKSLLALGEEVRNKLVQTREAVLDVTESVSFGGSHSAFMRASTQIRHPYVDPVNVIQAELLKRLRKMEGKVKELTEEEQKEYRTLQDALILSINAIAQGMRNSG